MKKKSARKCQKLTDGYKLLQFPLVNRRDFSDYHLQTVDVNQE